MFWEPWGSFLRGRGRANPKFHPPSATLKPLQADWVLGSCAGDFMNKMWKTSGTISTGWAEHHKHMAQISHLWNSQILPWQLWGEGAQPGVRESSHLGVLPHPQSRAGLETSSLSRRAQCGSSRRAWISPCDFQQHQVPSGHSGGFNSQIISCCISWTRCSACLHTLLFLI